MPRSSTRTRPVRRSRFRRAGESAYGALLVARTGLMGLLALLLLVAGVWTSWHTAQYAMLVKARERGMMTVSACAGERCTGPYVPSAGEGRRLAKVSIAEAAAPDKGARVEVTVKPGTTHAVRTGAAGILHAWVPFAGSLLLAALVVAGGMRLRRTAWVMGLLGAVLLGAAFTAL
ncbi:hypothetical protein RB199_36130 [Streptomyces libani]|uniref:Integral membrane protein n=3 Tax=Streptomyces nigrescens TaxID=1920 RepID=A0ABY7J908_STRNI|nr:MULTISPECIES: hypothetical protein [Streptomyces]AWN27654.1 hypothetical protein DKG71_17315 [Streptomyces sp. NEAU-S7GS2]MCX5450948.1 hypothetical protein [Streptomyces libani]WAT98585.1 hypothetical protein STRLI_004659 [Streptomyces libani subsp. libani]WAU06562.1 hypothetical protein STRNI_005074 [Streptomyces nigrescens]WDT55631.1 hypothetical protein NUT86_17070 [Streptomyces sp. G7(2002)]